MRLVGRRICLRAHGNQFVRVRNSSGELQVPPELGPDPWEIFTGTSLGAGRITLEPANSTPSSRMYLSAEGGGGGLVLARRAPAGDWETFTLETVSPERVRLRSHAGTYLCAEAGGGDLLLANRAEPDPWTTFELIELGHDRIALRATSGQYVRAESGGGGRVVVNRDNRDHEWVELDGTGPYVSVRAANGRYWCAVGGGHGGKPVLANQGTVGDHEQFGLISNADGSIALRAKEGRRYVLAADGGGGGLVGGGGAIGIWEKFVPTPWYDRPRPRKLLVYQGYPSLIENADGSLAEAARTFSRYEYVILGHGLEEATHPAHDTTRTVLANIRWNTAGATKVFGSVRLSAEDVADRAAAWRELGAEGIVLDGFGSAGERRRRQNDAVARVHALDLPVIVNAENPADAFDPAHGAVELTATDFYLWEGHAIRNGEFQDAAEWRAKAELLRGYQAELDFRVLSVATAGPAPFDEAKFDYAWYAAMLYGHEAFGWGERRAPYRRRPSLTPGYFTGDITVSGTAFERPTDAGLIFVDPARRTAGIR
jgi:Fascin domain